MGVELVYFRRLDTRLRCNGVVIMAEYFSFHGFSNGSRAAAIRPASLSYPFTRHVPFFP